MEDAALILRETLTLGLDFAFEVLHCLEKLSLSNPSSIFTNKLFIISYDSSINSKDDNDNR